LTAVQEYFQANQQLQKERGREYVIPSRNNTMNLMSLDNTAIHWGDVIEYPQTGTQSKILFEDENCRHILMSLSLGKAIAEHTNPRNATVNVIEGKGILTLLDKEIIMESGVFILIPANAPHAIQASTKLAFLLTLSEQFAQPTLKHIANPEVEIAPFTANNHLNF
jgi:quercetin dioxygenase-like cupin family protein